jgi:hypothetical protein
MNTNEKTLKDHYYQLSENIFEKREIKKLISIYGHTGYYWWSIIEIDLLKNNGIADKNWKYYSMNELDKDVIEYIFNMNEDNGNGTFSSINVNRQLEERKKLSEINTKKVNAYWDKQNKNKDIVDKPINDKPKNSLSCKFCGGKIVNNTCELCHEESKTKNYGNNEFTFFDDDNN